jgi:membrane protein
MADTPRNARTGLRGNTENMPEARPDAAPGAPENNAAPDARGTGSARGSASARDTAGAGGTTDAQGATSTAETPGTPKDPLDATVGLYERSGRRAPAGPTRMRGRSWLAAGKRTIREFADDALTDRAAALTYYAVLSIFPGLLVAVSLLGLAGKSAIQSLETNINQAVPGTVGKILTQAVGNLHGPTSAGIIAIVGLLGALWSASGYIAAFMRASNVVYDIPEGRPFWKTTPIRIGVTIVIMVMLVVSVLMVVITGGMATRVGQALGIGSTAVTIWNIAKWPVLLIIVSLMISILYWVAPNAKRGFQWVSPGGVLAVLVWLIASGLFAIYVANFAHYNKTYGSIAAVIIFLIWLYISNIAILLGAEYNAELERGRAVAAGIPLGREPYVEPRDLRKIKKQERRARKRQTSP